MTPHEMIAACLAALGQTRCARLRVRAGETEIELWLTPATEASRHESAEPTDEQVLFSAAGAVPVRIRSQR